MQRKAWIFMARSCKRNARAALFRAWTSASTFAARFKGGVSGAYSQDGYRESRRDGRIDRRVIHVADASAVVGVRPTTISRRFVTMPIKVDTLGGNPSSLAREERSPKMESATSERYLAIYDIDDHEPRDQDNAAFTVLIDDRLNLHQRNYYPDISSGPNSIRIRRSKYTNSPSVQTFRRFFMIFARLFDYLFGNWLVQLDTTTTSRTPK